MLDNTSKVASIEEKIGLCEVRLKTVQNEVLSATKLQSSVEQDIVQLNAEKDDKEQLIAIIEAGIVSKQKASEALDLHLETAQKALLEAEKQTEKLNIEQDKRESKVAADIKELESLRAVHADDLRLHTGHVDALSADRKKMEQAKKALIKVLEVISDI